MAIKAIVFDYGGVICFTPPPETEVELELLTGLPVKTLRELNQKYRGEWDLGKCDGIGYYRRILAKLGIFPDDESLARIANVDMDGWKRINPAAVQLMRDVKKAGFILGILSNMPHDFLAWAREGIPIFGEVDTAVFSCDCNVIKPNAEIYKILRKRIGCEYKEIVFFDDTTANVEAARELGIHGFLWEGPQTTRERISSLRKD